MKAKEYLEEIRAIDFEILLLEEQLELIEARMTGLSGGSTGERSGAYKDKKGLDDVIVRFLSKKENTIRKIFECENQRSEIIDKIVSLSNFDFRSILYKKYVLHKSFKEIADEIGYSEEYLRKLHSKALQLFEETYKSS